MSEASNSMKPAAALTASLLARKGQAAPAMGPRSVSHTLPQETASEGKPAPAPAQKKQDNSPVSSASAEPGMPEKSEEQAPNFHAETLTKLEDALIEKALERGMALAAEGHKLVSGSVEPVGSKGPAKAKAPVGQGERIAMTVRLSHEEHLKLKVFSAHTKLSSQEIFKQALECFMTKSAPRPLKSSCLCFREQE